MILEKKHKKKKPAQGWFVKYDAGNVPLNNAIFNSGVGAQGTGQAMGEELDAEDNKTLGIYKLIGTTPQSRNLPYYYISDNLQNITQLLDKLSKGKNRWKLICNIKSYDEDTDSYFYIDVPNWEQYDITTEGALNDYITLHKPNITPTKKYSNVYKCMKKTSKKELTENMQTEELKSFIIKNKLLILKRDYKELYSRFHALNMQGSFNSMHISDLTHMLLESGIDFLPYVGEEIPYGCFRYLNIDNIDIPSNIEVIAGYAFAECDNITSITIPKTIKSIGNRAFYECTSLQHINLPDHLQRLPGVFESCLALEHIDLPSNLTKIDARAFSNCTSLIDINIPNKVESIERLAFNNCTSLTSIVIPINVKHIEADAFYNCINLKEITIKNKDANISTGAFSKCPKLKGIYYAGSEEDWAKRQIKTSKKTTIHYNS